LSIDRNKADCELVEREEEKLSLPGLARRAIHDLLPCGVDGVVRRGLVVVSLRLGLSIVHLSLGVMVILDSVLLMRKHLSPLLSVAVVEPPAFHPRRRSAILGAFLLDSRHAVALYFYTAVVGLLVAVRDENSEVVEHQAVMFDKTHYVCLDVLFAEVASDESYLDLDLGRLSVLVSPGEHFPGD
jgi:hypothetical protein